jgi:hypothetical protein
MSKITVWQIPSWEDQGLLAHLAEHIPGPADVCYLFAVTSNLKKISSSER